MTHTEIASSTPGRTRFRVPPHHRHQLEMERIASGLQAQSNIHHVEYNAQTGSILVHHDADRTSLEDVKDMMRDLGVVFADLTEAAELVSVGGLEGELDIISALYDLNQRIRELTRGIIDLRFILPLGIGALGIFQLMTYGMQIEVIPWYVLIYLAIDLFIRLNFNPYPTAQNSQAIA